VLSLFTLNSNAVMWCPSDPIYAPPSLSQVTSNTESSYDYRFVVWDNSAVLYPGLKLANFVRPSLQVIYHEDCDFHYLKTTNFWPPLQPTLNSVYGDLHARPWKVLNQQIPVTQLYDPNWFYFNKGVPSPNQGSAGTVEDSWDDAY
jgi:hypothetical protein